MNGTKKGHVMQSLHWECFSMSRYMGKRIPEKPPFGFKLLSVEIEARVPYSLVAF